MTQSLIVRGRYSGRTFIPDGTLPNAEEAAELVITLDPPRTGASVAVDFGAAPMPRPGDEILGQVRAERAEWSDL